MIPLPISTCLQILNVTPVMGTTRLLPSYSQQIIKGDKMGLSEGSGKPLLYVDGERRVEFLPILIVLSWLPLLRGT